MRGILVTGAAGLCGHAIAECFQQSGNWNVIGCGRRPSTDSAYVQHDLTRELPLGPSGFPLHIDAVVHAAAIVDEKASTYDIIDGNVRSAFNVARYAIAAGAKNFINLSSIAVYGSPTVEEVYAEDRRPQPVSLYGLSKLLSEQLLNSVLIQLPLCHFRLSYVLGRGMSRSTLIHRWHEQLRRHENVVVVNPDTSRLTFIDSRNVADACIKAIEYELEGTYNLSSTLSGANEPTLREIYNAIREVVPDSRAEVEFRNQPEHALRASYPSDLVKRSLEELDFIARRDSLRFALDELR